MQKKYAKAWQRGFTLIELMIVVAVVAILSAIALPSYNEYIRRGHRADAKAGLLQAAQWMERAATAAGTYPAALATSLTWSTDASKRYEISMTSGTPTNGFTLTATRRAGAQANDKCGDFTLTNTGVQGVRNNVAGNSAEDCWRK